jgi:SAM-dependent methyltransferase
MTQGAAMRHSDPGASLVCPDRDVYEACLALDDADVLDLGCGRAEHSRAIAKTHPRARVVAMDVDAIQHEINCRSERPPNLTFAYGGAQAIPAGPGSFDVVLMFKSLHHVPGELLDRALAEIARVLRPGGLAYVCEPIFAGPLNEIMRIFHDEERVRLAAFDAVRRAVSGGMFALADERFFAVPTRFRDFAEFDAKVLRATHTKHHLEPAQLEAVRERFAASMTAEGAQFAAPQRLDLLVKAA